MFSLYTYKENCPTPGGHVFPPITTIFKLARDIHITNVLTKLHDDWAKNVTFSVHKLFYYINIRKKTHPPCGHVFFTDPNHFRTQLSYAVSFAYASEPVTGRLRVM
ncbi:hypothetical protein DPMN_083154 [Dreissena polymorpha]|uniref:Uncharacterized protein n=1 Tax=Dreissena polymorpha TaxID=45954 RepID=A0A9D3YBC9_DREPO|nr:hypothetical protein DPMN_083154 [Dreissena polymorpha]